MKTFLNLISIPAAILGFSILVIIGTILCPIAWFGYNVLYLFLTLNLIKLYKYLTSKLSFKIYVIITLFLSVSCVGLNKNFQNKACVVVNKEICPKEEFKYTCKTLVSNKTINIYSLESLVNVNDTVLVKVDQIGMLYFVTK